MPDKQAPLGICDLCGDPIPRDRWYTSKGKPRLYCGRECRNTANSRAGNEERTRKVRQRIERGEWQNPAHLRPPTSAEQAHRARLGRLREVERGEWRNPALSDEARRKLSRPRKHTGALARAIERLSAGARVSDLTAVEADAHRAYRRELQRQQWQNMSEAEKEQRRSQWRAIWRRRHSP